MVIRMIEDDMVMNDAHSNDSDEDEYDDSADDDDGDFEDDCDDNDGDKIDDDK